MVLLIVALVAVLVALAFPALEYFTVYRVKAPTEPTSLVTPGDKTVPPDTEGLPAGAGPTPGVEKAPPASK